MRLPSMSIRVTLPWGTLRAWHLSSQRTSLDDWRDALEEEHCLGADVR